jgi:hypothetical protein
MTTPSPLDYRRIEPEKESIHGPNDRIILIVLLSCCSIVLLLWFVFFVL